VSKLSVQYGPYSFFFNPTDSFYDTFHTIADVMYFCQMLAIMEVINPAVGLVKTGVMPAFIQVCLVHSTPCFSCQLNALFVLSINFHDSENYLHFSR